MTAQKLRLSAPEKRRLADFLTWNARDENKYYLYDYYRDNCATRLRDVIDRVTGGALARASTSPAAMTFRAHTARLTADDPLVYFGLYATMGSFIDRPITAWEEMFLPGKVEEQVRHVVVPTEHGPAPLVESESVLVRDARPPPRAEPPRWTPQMFLLGASAGVVLGALGRWARSGGRRAGGRLACALLGAVLTALGLAAGLWGCLSLFLWTCTDHEVAYHNENLLQCAPVALLLLGPGIALIRNRAPSALALRLLSVCLAGSALGWALKALPWFTQDNAQVIALLLPLWAGAVAAVAWARRAGFLRADNPDILIEGGFS